MSLPDGLAGPSAVELIRVFADRGVDTHHSSSEYDTYDLYVDALRQLRSTGHEFSHIVKLAEPSWNHTNFCSKRLSTAIDQERSALGTDCLDVVQWLVRTPDPSDDETTSSLVRSQAAAIAEAFAHHRQAGRIGEVAVFSYTPAFSAAIERAIETTLDPAPIASGFAVYLNELEQEALPLVDRRQTIAIRPFAGGRLKATANSAAWPLRHPNVSTVIASASTLDHATQLCAWTEAIEPNENEFERSQ